MMKDSLLLILLQLQDQKLHETLNLRSNDDFLKKMHFKCSIIKGPLDELVHLDETKKRKITVKIVCQPI